MKRALLLISALFITLSSFSAIASNETKVIKISAGEWPPFIGQNLKDFGYVGKTIQQVFASQGYQVEFHFYPWKRAYKKASDGEYVATAVWMFAKERTEHFIYSDPVAQEQFVFFHLKEEDFQWQSLDDLINKHLGGGLGYSYGEELDSMINTQQVTINRVESPSKAFQLLKYRRVDLVPEEKHIGLFSLSKLPIETQELITYHPVPFLSNDSYVLFSKTHPESEKLITIFNQGLKEYQASP
ncbi:transporter substrate-binding domain-containing protein [Vibrio sp. ZSDE26]|uniref:Transporter substrate-binding domain-containing protein n=1 Tax=Vibrio amylolyticus TaxID=2847292 RepID=A0A9X1XLD9_9VIBR|nr:transporter substrate-binding domain-containing protein [Vibrio amylolyticus]MCK6263005.1 transporter substrate-binding domain-containing protein [Vibrio amylolyticus]